MAKTNKNTMMRIPKALIKDLKAIKLSVRESHANTVKRLIDKNRSFKKLGKPISRKDLLNG